MHSLASVDAGTQTDEEIGKNGNHSLAKTGPSPMVKETEHVTDSDESDTPYEEHECAEVETAVPVVARARVVSVQKPTPPSLPPRNPNRTHDSSEREVKDGFDQVPLNGSTGYTGHDGRLHEGQTADPSREGGRVSHDGTGQGAANDFHSIPTTPAEKREDTPRSFE